MHFLSSKVVRELQTAFTCILDSHRIKQGQKLLEKLKKQENFEVALATFISRSQVYHQRLLAVLQLEKQLSISDVQTAWSLREIYYKDSDKIAHKICKLITAKENIKLASEFLKVDKNQSGLSVYRQIQVVFNMLKHQEKAGIAIQHHFRLLCDYFQAVIQLLQCQQECFFFVMVCLALFYWSGLNCHSSQISEQLLCHWSQIQAKCTSANNDQTGLLVQTIKGFAENTPIQYKNSALFSFLKATFQSITRNNTLKLQYFSKGLEMVVLRNSQLLFQPQLRLQFIEAIMFQNANNINQMISNFKRYGELQIQLDNELQLQNKSEALVRSLCCRLIETLFAEHYKWIKLDHLSSYSTTVQAFESLLSLVNYYNSKSLPSISQTLTSLLTQVYEALSNHQSANSQGLNQRQVTQYVTLIQFLTKFKSEIDISILPSVVNVLVDKGRQYDVLSPFCDAFMSGVWKQLTYMQTGELANFIDFHLSTINDNLWTIRFESYECFLHLAIYLEQTNNYFTTCSQNDTLLISFINSHQIICQILSQNTQAKMNFQLFQMLLELTAFLIENKALSSCGVCNKLSISLLVERIQRHLLLSEVSAKIVAFSRFQSKQVIDCLKKESEEWEIDELDYAYRIQLYLKQIEYASHSLSSAEINALTKELGTKIIAFLRNLDPNQLNKIKISPLWQQLQRICNIHSFFNQRMEIQIL